VARPASIDRSVPQGVSVALYKGTRPGLLGLYNRAGRFLDRGPYSHCEIVFSDGVSWSSSLIDGGVRSKQINYSIVGNWDFLPLGDTGEAIEERILDWFLSHEGDKYDVMGNIRFAFGMFRDSPHKWFCSEAVMAAIGYSQAYRYGPSGMVAILERLTGDRVVVVEDNYP